MSARAHGQSFRLAPMSRWIRWLTLSLLALPVALAVAPLLEGRVVTALVLFVGALYVWIWVRFRPSQFVVESHALRVEWPGKRREIPLAEIASVRTLDRAELRREIGWGMRVGAGGLWGGFGWLWTKRRGIVQLYVSRTDGFVWIERVGARPWLITPERPPAFAAALNAARAGASLAPS